MFTYYNITQVVSRATLLVALIMLSSPFRIVNLIVALEDRGQESLNFHKRMISSQTLTVTDAEALQGYISSPNYPQPYPINSSSSVQLYITHNESLTAIRLTFEHLQLQISNNCEGEVLKFFLYDLQQKYDDLRQAPMVFAVCGSQTPEPLVVYARGLLMKFFSDEFNTGKSKGFKVKFEFLNAQTQLYNGCDRPNQFKCRNRKCISIELLCNKFDDCGDGSDEDTSSSCDNLPTINYRIDYKCGISSFDQDFSHSTTSHSFIIQNRIVGGHQAKTRNKFLPQVSIQMIGIEPISHICGGVLIHPMFVLTSAHCFDQILPSSSYKLLFGLQDLRSFDTETSQVRYPNYISIFPGLSHHFHDPEMGALERANSLALVELNAPIKLNSHVWPACLPHLSETVTAGRECLVVGFGDTRGTGLPFSVKQVLQTIIHKNDCRSLYSNVSIDDYNMICVGGRFSTGPCNGDSGGPLLCREGPDNLPINVSDPVGAHETNNRRREPGDLIRYLTDGDVDDGEGNVRNRGPSIFTGRRRDSAGTYTVQGIISFTTDGNSGGGFCGLQGVPTIYGRVSTKVEWILSVMRLAMYRLNKEDRQQDRNNKSALFGYMFRSGLSLHENFTRPMTIYSG